MDYKDKYLKYKKKYLFLKNDIKGGEKESISTIQYLYDIYNECKKYNYTLYMYTYQEINDSYKRYSVYSIKKCRLNFQNNGTEVVTFVNKSDKEPDNYDMLCVLHSWGIFGNKESYICNNNNNYKTSSIKKFCDFKITELKFEIYKGFMSKKSNSSILGYFK